MRTTDTNPELLQIVRDAVERGGFIRGGEINCPICGGKGKLGSASGLIAYPTCFSTSCAGHHLADGWRAVHAALGVDPKTVHSNGNGHSDDIRATTEEILRRARSANAAVPAPATESDPFMDPAAVAPEPDTAAVPAPATEPAVAAEGGSGFTAASVEALRVRALTPEQAREFGILPVLSKEDLPDGFQWAWDGPGMLIQRRSRDRAQASPQFRPDTATKIYEGEEEPRKYVCPKDSGSPLNWLREHAEGKPVLVVEGALKGPAVAAWAPEGYGVVAVPGCRVAGDADLTWSRDLDIVIALDKDSDTNPDVWQGGTDLRGRLLDEAAKSVKFLKPAGAKGKDGIDDVLGRRPEDKRTSYLATLVERAVPSLGTKPKPKPKATGKTAGEVTLAPGYELPNPNDPMAVARALEPKWTREGRHILRHWRGSWMHWEGAHWTELDARSIRANLYKTVEPTFCRAVDKRTGDSVVVPWAPTRSKIADLTEAVQAITNLTDSTDAPSWLNTDGPTTVVACQNGIVDVATRQLIPPTPAFFNLAASPLNYDPEAPDPTEWLKFLESVWPGDDQAKLLLQEWFGYVISGRTDLQKALLLAGEKRAGKGTISRILTAIVGKEYVASPTMKGLTTNFGLAPLVGASLAIVPDARLPRQEAETAMERILSITGEDSLDVDRKYRDAWTGRLSVRFMISANGLLPFADASGAIASRFVILTFAHSFLGKEDTGLEGRLMEELPGILNWALDGLESLSKRGRFVQPESSATAAELFSEGVSPIKTFLDDCCAIGPELSVDCDQLYAVWHDWCQAEAGRDHPGLKATFGRNLFAALPSLKKSQATTEPGGKRVRRYNGVGLGKNLPPSRPRVLEPIELEKGNPFVEERLPAS